MAKGLVFGVTNGIITMLALITGMYASKVKKVGIIAAILAILIADPLSDAYSMYISEKSNKHVNAFNVGKEAFLSQFVLQLVFLLIIVFSSNVLNGLILCYIFGLFSILGYSFYNSSPFKEVALNLLWMIIIIGVTYYSDLLVHKYYNN
jgi:phosphatidylglycerophosphate synthase